MKCAIWPNEKRSWWRIMRFGNTMKDSKNMAMAQLVRGGPQPQILSSECQVLGFGWHQNQNSKQHAIDHRLQLWQLWTIFTVSSTENADSQHVAHPTLVHRCRRHGGVQGAPFRRFEPQCLNCSLWFIDNTWDFHSVKWQVSQVSSQVFIFKNPIQCIDWALCLPWF